VTRNADDNASLRPMVEQVCERCGQPPGQILADSVFFSIVNLERMEAQHLDTYVPDSNLAGSLNLGIRCRQKACAAAHRRMRRKLKTEEGRLAYGRRKPSSNPVFGVMKQLRNMRQPRTQGIENVGNEWTLAAMAYNSPVFTLQERGKPASVPPIPSAITTPTSLTSGPTQVSTPDPRHMRSVLTQTLRPLSLRKPQPPS
jgi:hypothetical protein